MNIFRPILGAFLLAALLIASGCGIDNADEVSSMDVLRSLPYMNGTSQSPDCLTGVVFMDTARVCAGYRLFTVPELGFAELLDFYGNSVHSWQISDDEYWARSLLTDNGDLLVIGRSPRGNPVDGIADSTRFIQCIDWSGRILWKNYLTAHHDIDILRDGRLILLAFTRELDSDISPTVQVRDDCIFLMQADGSIIEDTLFFLDAVRSSPALFDIQTVRPSTLGGTPWIDLFHSNSIDWIEMDSRIRDIPGFQDADVLVCFRHQDRIALFDWDSQSILWSWGGSEEISGPHNASVLENGNILLFDNGLGLKRSRAIEIDPETGLIEWEYAAEPPESFYTASKGSAQRLPNGNTLLAESDYGRSIEVSTEGEIVWEYICPYSLSDGRRSAIVRMTWYNSDFIESLLNR